MLHLFFLVWFFPYGIFCGYSSGVPAKLHLAYKLPSPTTVSRRLHIKPLLLLSNVKKHRNPEPALRLWPVWQRLVKFAFYFGVAAMSGITTDPDPGGYSFRLTSKVFIHLNTIQRRNCFLV